MSLLKDIQKNKKKMEKALGVNKPVPKKAPEKAPASKKPQVIVKRSKLVKFNKDLYVENGTAYEWEMGDERYYLYYEDEDHILGYLPATLNTFIDEHDDGQSLTIDVLIDGSVILIYDEVE